MATRFELVVLPDEVNNSTAGRCLQRVMQHILLFEYDQARQLWCQNVLGLPFTNPAGPVAHSLYDTTFAVFQDKLPGIFILSKNETTYCDSPFCPRPERTRRHRFNQFDNGTYDPITQDTFDRAMLHKNEDPPICDNEFDSATIRKMDPKYWRVDSRFDDDMNPDEYYACRGRRKYTAINILQYPTIMIVTNLKRQDIRKLLLP
ncbi:hypothetical protein FBU30_003239, partial [Linnemannia zychae]